MGTFHTPRTKTIFFLACWLLSVCTTYFTNIPQAGERATSPRMMESAQWAALTSFDLPVHITVKEDQPMKTQATIAPIPLDHNCDAQVTLCKKILFIGEFSQTQKRHYQEIVIRQINRIDDILAHNVKLSDVLYSLTLHSEKGSRRWRAGSKTITLNMGNFHNDEEFIEILTHELWHIVDLSVLQWNSRLIQNSFYNVDNSFFRIDDPSVDFYTISRKNNTTRHADARTLSFVGGYAMSDPFEDFAESFNLYLNHHHVFSVLATTDQNLRKKYQFMSKLFDKQYLQSDYGTALAMKRKLQTRPWDTTKGY